MFKIVQTIERGEAQLCVVPHKWEKKGKLYWPKMRADKLITEGDSAPGKNWLEMQCTLKRQNLSLDNAEKELGIMMSCTDTDEVSVINPSAILNQRRKPRVLLPKRSNDITITQDFNDIATALVINSNVSPMKPSSASSLSTNIAGVAHPVEQRQVVLTIPTENEIFTSGDMPTEAGSFDLNLPFLDTSKYDSILKNQEEILKNQNSILKQLAAQAVQLDECLKHKVNSSAKVDHNDNNDDFSFNIIKTVEKLKTFEKNLATEGYFQIFIKRMSVIYGTSGRENGTNVCYALVDKIFPRKFMPKCSWAGGSRGENRKVAFKIHTNVIKMFFELMHAADATFTLDACEQFFKNILKNSTKRSNMQGSRCSKVKRRPKHLVYKSQSDIEQQHITAEAENMGNKLKKAKSQTNTIVDAASDSDAANSNMSNNDAESEDNSEDTEINNPQMAKAVLG